jgi:hypothetical protein
MATAATTQTPSGRNVPVAGRLHTTFLLAILGVWAFVGRIAVGRMQPAADPHRVRSYLLTLLVEWLVFIYVVAGVRRRGMSALAVLGTRWNSFREVLRDIGIASAFWLAAGGGSAGRGQVSLRPHATAEPGVSVASCGGRVGRVGRALHFSGHL